MYYCEHKSKNGRGLGTRLPLPRLNPALYCLFTCGKNRPGDKTDVTHTIDERMPGWLSKNANLDFETLKWKAGFSNYINL